MRRPGAGAGRRGALRAGLGGSVLLAPSNTVAPVISGTRGGTLSCTTGTWAGVPAPTYAYQWQRGATIGGGGAWSNISGATSPTYADTGTNLYDVQCIVTGTNAAGSGTGTSNTLADEANAIANITNINYFAAAAGGPTLSAANGFTIAVCFRKITAGNLVREWRFQRYVAATSGYQTKIYDGVNSRVAFTCLNATPAAVSEVNTIASLSQDTIHRFVATFTGTGGTSVLETYMDGSLLSAGTTLASYTAETAAFRIEASGVTDEIEIVSVSAVSDLGIASAAVSSWDTQVTGGGSRALPSATHHWEANDWAGSGSWTDRIAGLALALAAAAPTKRAMTGATWA